MEGVEDEPLTRWMMRDHGGTVEVLPEAPSWFAEAACYGSDIDYVEPGGKDAVRAALALCEGCPVRAACAEAGASEPYGIWGGMTERERARARQDDRKAA